MTEYLKNIEVKGILIAYHGAGAEFLPEVPKYATQNAADYSENGGGKALIDNFTTAFGEIFDNSIHRITNVIEEEKITIGGIDNAIHTFAGVQLRLACAKLMKRQEHEEETGRAKITPAYNLPCRYVLHTVGPIIHGRLAQKDKELLSSCYRSCLELAEQNGLKSIAFCCISTGEFNFPNDKAAQTAIETVKEYKEQTHSEIEVIFNVFKELDYNIYRELL